MLIFDDGARQNVMFFYFISNKHLLLRHKASEKICWAKATKKIEFSLSNIFYILNHDESQPSAFHLYPLKRTLWHFNPSVSLFIDPSLRARLSLRIAGVVVGGSAFIWNPNAEIDNAPPEHKLHARSLQMDLIRGDSPNIQDRTCGPACGNVRAAAKICRRTEKTAFSKLKERIIRNTNPHHLVFAASVVDGHRILWGILKKIRGSDRWHVDIAAFEWDLGATVVTE